MKLPGVFVQLPPREEDTREDEIRKQLKKGNLDKAKDLIGEILQDKVNTFCGTRVKTDSANQIESTLATTLNHFVQAAYVHKFRTYQTDLDPTLPYAAAVRKREKQHIPSFYVVAEVAIYFMLGAPYIQFVFEAKLY